MITEREFLERARLDRRTLTVWIEEEWLIPGSTADELAFTDMDLARANLIHDLKDKMGVNHEGLGVVLHLLDQMHALRRALAAALKSARSTAFTGAIKSRSGPARPIRLPTGCEWPAEALPSSAVVHVTVPVVIAAVVVVTTEHRAGPSRHRAYRAADHRARPVRRSRLRSRRLRGCRPFVSASRTRQARGRPKKSKQSCA